MVIAMAVAGAVIVAGVLVCVVALIPRVPRRRPAVRKRLSWRSPWVLAVVSLLVGGVIAIVTGWWVACILAPALALGLPYLVGRSTAATDIAKLEAMEEWTRSLAGILTAGSGIEQAIMSTLRSTPQPIAPQVTLLVARLRARWPTPVAIRAFADDLNDPTGDIIAANLLLGASRRGAGLSSVLEGLAESVAFDIRGRRQVEADQAKPRATARWVTIITVAVLCLLFASGDYVAAYKQGFGTLVLMVLLAAYAAVLVWMKKLSTGETLPRFLGSRP